ncbi:MAG: ribosomal RNA small subunit methyltransferase A [Spirochaetes bacterium GWB1_36_13]|nr:MAG: ribosomal RNA small subunit methyltransferase A [Spirochaetes bacterium GWB1_36_13]
MHPVYKPETLKTLLLSLNLSLTKEKGQNFLLDSDVLAKMASFFKDTLPILEIGPGIGHFTRYLIEKNQPVTVVELDKGFVRYLEKELGKKIKIIHKDFLKFSFSDLEYPKIVLAGNIPYSITKDILFRLFRNLSFIDEAFILMQAEAGEKLLAEPGTKKYGRLSVLTGFYTEAQILFYVPPKAFFPQPHVDSVYMRFKPKNKDYDKGFEEWLNIVFSNRRKTLASVFKKKLGNEIFDRILKEFAFTVNTRAETLDPETLYKLYLKMKQ